MKRPLYISEQWNPPNQIIIIKKLKTTLLALHGEIKRSEHIGFSYFECESGMAFCRMKVVLLCRNGSVLQQERSLSSTADVWQYRSTHCLGTHCCYEYQEQEESTISFVLLSRAYASDQHRKFKQSNYLEGKHFQLVAWSHYSLPTTI